MEHNMDENNARNNARNNGQPVHAIRYGNVSVAVWANNSSVGYFFNTTFRRVFKQGDDWGESTSFDDRDLPNLEKAAADAHSWIQRQKQSAVTTWGSSEPRHDDDDGGV